MAADSPNRGGPRILLVYYTYTQQSPRVVEAMSRERYLGVRIPPSNPSRATSSRLRRSRTSWRTVSATVRDRRTYEKER